MDPDIRPQDDLFGHVNGRWLDEEDIPADRSSWGPFVQLADQAEQHVHAIIEELAGRAATLVTTRTPRRSPTSTHSFMDEESVEAKGSKPIRPVLEAAADLRDVRDLAAFLGDFEKNGGGGLFSSYVDNDDRDAERNIVYVRQGGLGLPDETYYRDDKFAEKREKYVEHLERMFGLVGHDDAGRRRRDRAARGDPARRGPLGAGRDPRRHQDLQPQDAGRAEGPLPGLRLGRVDPQPRRQPRHPGRGLRPAAVVPRAPLGRAHRDAHRGLADLDGREGRPRRRAVPLRARSSRRTSTSTAAPWAVRRSCGPAGSAASRWSRARSARPSAASTPSGTSRRAPRR